MRIAIMATGAVGGYFGGRLAAAGHDVTFFARGANLAALRTNGLKIESPLGDLHLQPVTATDDAKAVAPVDIVLFAVKLWDLESAAESIRPIIGASTQVITVQNGVDAVERMSPILGASHVVPGIALISAVISAPGTIKQVSKFASIRCGHLDKHRDATLVAFAEAAQKANVDIALTDEIERELWEKFVFLSGMASITAATGESIGRVLADPDTRALYLKLMQEAVAVGRAKGVPLPPDAAEQRLHLAETTISPEVKASMAHDLARGNRLELDWLAGRIVALGRALGVPTPANDAVYAVLKLHRMGKVG